jgi:PKD repeat protein
MADGTGAVAPIPPKRPGRRLVAIALVVVALLAGGVVAVLVLLGPGLPAPQENAPVASFDVTRSRMHVDLDASPTTDPNADIATYEWDFQDDGTFDASGITASVDFVTPGRYTIRLRVTDQEGHVGAATRFVSVATSTLDLEFSDFFGVPFGEWWDYRGALYGEAAVGAECFNQTGIDNGLCVPSDPAVPDVAAFPYTHWWDLPAARGWADPNNIPTINAPYRVHAVGDRIPGYTLERPVFLPVLNESALPGGRLEFDWRLRFLDTATTENLEASGCPVTTFALDGYHIRSQVSITLDLQESRRVFGVEAVDAAAAQAWWDAQTLLACAQKGPLETAVESWYLDMGGRPTAAGKYDIFNAYEWFWDPVFTSVEASVAPNGTTLVTIDNVAWGTGNLLSRMFYWGNASYLDDHLDSTHALGWLGMEPLGWFEDFAFVTSFAPGGFDFSLDAVVQYHFRHVARPGADGALDRNGDVPAWTWGPVLQDYLNDFGPGHLASELDRYPGALEPLSTPGASLYGDDVDVDYAPVRWDLAAGQTWRFVFPSSDVIFFDPNLTPVPANPVSRDHVRIAARLGLADAEPAGYGVYDPAARTWEAYGPETTGGPPGSPGADGIPGTADDAYAAEPLPEVVFEPDVQGAALISTSGLPWSYGSTGPALLATGAAVCAGPDGRRAPKRLIPCT